MLVTESTPGEGLHQRLAKVVIDQLVLKLHTRPPTISPSTLFNCPALACRQAAGSQGRPRSFPAASMEKQFNWKVVDWGTVHPLSKARRMEMDMWCSLAMFNKVSAISVSVGC